jgi:hypothetical protein
VTTAGAAALATFKVLEFSGYLVARKGVKIERLTLLTCTEVNLFNLAFLIQDSPLGVWRVRHF